MEPSAGATMAPARSAGPAWVVVLPPDPDLHAALRAALTARGWQLELSVAREQAVAVVAGPASVAELSDVWPAGEALEVVPLLSRRQYAGQRALRRFLTAMALALALIMLVAGAIPVLGFLEPPDVPLTTPEELRLGPADRLPPGSYRRDRFRNQPVLVVHDEHGRFFALSGRCTHMDDCLLEWSPERRQVVCPCHGCVYDSWGNVVLGPPSIPLARFVVERRGDVLFLRLGS